MKKLTQTQIDTLLDAAACGWITTGVRVKDYLRYEIDYEAGDNRKVYCLTEAGAAYVKQLTGRDLKLDSDGAWYFT
jgi:hypothetical protein